MNKLDNLLSTSIPRTTEEGAIALARVHFQQRDSSHGIPYPNMKTLNVRPKSGYRAVYSYDKENQWREDLKRIGLDGWETLLRCEIYMEPDENVNAVYTPLSFNAPFRYTVMDLNLAAQNSETDSEVKKWIQRILDNLDPKLDPKLYFQWSRIIIVDMKEDNLHIRLPLTLQDLNPGEVKTAIIERGKAALAALQRTGKGATSRLERPDLASENLWEAMFEEIKNPTTRADIRAKMEAAVAASRANTPEETEAAAQDSIDDVIWHEFAHALAPFMNPTLFGRMVKVMSNTQMVPVNSVWVKNRGKACLDTRVFRSKLGRSVDDTTETWQHWKFFDEQFADYFGIYLKTRLGGQHFLTQRYGITVLPELEKFFDEYYTNLIERSKCKQCFILTEEDLKSAMLFAQEKVSAAYGLTATMPISPFSKEWTQATTNYI